jgi:hypothetical protein
MICGVQWVWTTKQNRREVATSKGKGALAQHKKCEEKTNKCDIKPNKCEIAQNTQIS